MSTAPRGCETPSRPPAGTVVAENDAGVSALQRGIRLVDDEWLGAVVCDFGSTGLGASGRFSTFDVDRSHGTGVVERGFDRANRWRGVAARDDKTAANDLGAPHLTSTLMWASDLADPSDST